MSFRLVLTNITAIKQLRIILNLTQILTQDLRILYIVWSCDYELTWVGFEMCEGVINEYGSYKNFDITLTRSSSKNQSSPSILVKNLPHN